MTDEHKQPDDVVDGFDLPGGEATPPPEMEDVTDDTGAFEMPEGEDVETPDAAPSTEVTDGFDLPGGEVVPPPIPDGASLQTVAPHVKAAEKRPSVLGKFIALIVIPAIVIPVVLYMMREKKKEAESYKEDYVRTVETFLTYLSKTEYGEAYEMLSDDLRFGKNARDTEYLEGEYVEAAEGFGDFKTLSDVKWDEPKRGQPYSAFRAKTVFADGAAYMWFRLMGADNDIQIAEYRFSVAGEEKPPAEDPNVTFLKGEYLKAAQTFMKHLASGDVDAAHALLTKTVQARTTTDALSQQFESAAGTLGNFTKFADVTWRSCSPARQFGAFDALAQFSGGAIRVHIELRGSFSVGIAAFRFSKD